MGKAKVGAIPEPMRKYVKRARIRKHANNKDKNKPGRWVLTPSPLEAAIIANIPASEKTRAKPNGVFYRLGWSTPASRAEEEARALLSMAKFSK